MLMKSPRFSTRTLMRSGIAHIRLSSVSAEMLRQAERAFSMRVASEVAGCLLSTLSWLTSTRSFRLVYCPVILPSPKRQICWPGTTAGYWGRWGSILLKNGLRNVGQKFGRCWRLVLRPSSHRRCRRSLEHLLHVEVRCDSFAAGHNLEN